MSAMGVHFICGEGNRQPLNKESFVKLIVTVLAAAWLTSGCFTNPPDQDSSGVGHRDPRTGLCHDATPPPCEPPKD
jgi:hypothetical protein